MSQKHAQELGDILSKLEPLGKQRNDAKKRLLASMVKTNTPELQVNGRVFSVKRQKVRPSPIAYKDVKTWLTDWTADKNVELDADDFVAFIKTQRVAPDAVKDTLRIKQTDI
jgi:hypothetical protein